MNIQIIPALEDDKEILRHLLEKYDYEFSQYDLRDVNRFGLFGYSYLDHYWTEPNRWAYFIFVDDTMAGFAMVNDFPEVEETDFTLAEFFVMYKYRRIGVGEYAARYIFDTFKGRWQLKRHPKNVGSVLFWNKVVREYTHGAFRLVEAYPGVKYDDGSLADVFFFDSANVD